VIIDAHVHHMPLEVYKQFHDPEAPPKKCYLNGNDFTLSPRLFKTDDQLRAMDFAGVDMALLALAQWNLAGPKICRMINEGMANHVAKYKDRFRACASIPVADKEAAIQEIDYAIQELKLSGIALLTSQSQELTPSNKEYMWPIYAKAVEYDIPVLWHPHLLPYNTETDCTINRVVGRGFDISRVILRLIYDVLPEFPTLKTIIPHYGGGFLAHKQRAIAFFEPKKDLGVPVPPDLKPMPKSPCETEEFGYKAAFDEMFNKLYIDGAGSGGWEPITRMAFMVVRHDRLVFGTDFPFEVHNGRDLKYYLDSVRRLDVSEEDRKAFLGGNLAALLKLTQQAAAKTAAS
jgi:predicted TIM-barrel fold metal-dependent hydrolase